MLLVPCPDPFYQLVCPSPAAVRAGSGLPRNTRRLLPSSGGGQQPMNDCNGTQKGRPFSSSWDNPVIQFLLQEPPALQFLPLIHPASFTP